MGCRPEGEVAPGSQQLPGPRIADLGVEPAPRGGCVDQVEGLRRGRSPFFEGGLDDAHLGERLELAPGDGGELVAELHAGDLEATPSERHGRLSRATTNFEKAITRAKIGEVR